MKSRVTGIGGIFFKSEDPNAAKALYKKHLGLNTDDYGSTFLVEDKDSNDCATKWSLIDRQTGYFTPSKKQFIINFGVENLDELLKTLNAEGVSVLGEPKNYDMGNLDGF